MKWLADVLPFLEPYPSWVKVVLSAWVFLSAICIVALLVARPPAVVPNGNTSKTASNTLWLKIKKVESYNSSFDNAGVQVTISINGNTYVYPNRGETRWVVPGPDMSPGIFKIPASEKLELSMTMKLKRQGIAEEAQFVSQRLVVIDREKLPYSGDYAVHELGAEKFRGGGIAATVAFSVSPQAD